jgi:nitrous oxide reductase
MARNKVINTKISRLNLDIFVCQRAKNLPEIFARGGNLFFLKSLGRSG